MKTLATPHNIRELERSAPVSDDEQALIVTAFKLEYYRQIMTWTLTNKNSARRTLFALLNGESAGELNHATETRRSAELILRSTSSQIDFNRAFFGRPDTRRINVKRFESKGCDEVFNRQPLPPLNQTQSGKSATLAEFLVRQLMRPEFVDQVIGVADGYVNLLRELQEWLERRQGHYPVDLIASHPRLSPNAGRELTAKTQSQDHLYPSGYHPKQVSKVPRLRELAKKYELKTGTTTYNDMYGPGYNDGAKAVISAMLKPLELSKPFALLPETHVDETNEISDELRRQSITNTQAGKANRAIFESATCL